MTGMRMMPHFTNKEQDLPSQLVMQDAQLSEHQMHRLLGDIDHELAAKVSALSACCQSLFDAADTNGDGMISYPEMMGIFWRMGNRVASEVSALFTAEEQVETTTIKRNRFLDIMVKIAVNFHRDGVPLIDLGQQISTFKKRVSNEHLKHGPNEGSVLHKTLPTCGGGAQPFGPRDRRKASMLLIAAAAAGEEHSMALRHRRSVSYHQQDIHDNSGLSQQQDVHGIEEYGMMPCRKSFVHHHVDMYSSNGNSQQDACSSSGNRKVTLRDNCHDHNKKVDLAAKLARPQQRRVSFAQ